MASKPADATLLDVLIDGFEKNEIISGFHVRTLPLPSGAIAARKFDQFLEEALKWKGEPTRLIPHAPRRVAVWSDLEIRQAGRGIILRVKSPWFSRWDENAWRGTPLAEVYDWLTVDEQHATKSGG